MSLAERPTISLLHATYQRPGGPNEIRDRWLASADHPAHVEYVVAMDSHDATAIATTTSDLRVISPSSPSVTAVRNWNAAANLASGDLLIVISDDLTPPPHWDTALDAQMAPLRPRDHAFAMKVTDSPQRSTLLRHPVISRAFYRTHGLFDARYTGVYCDDDITTRAYWKAFILDATAVVLDHLHPSTTSVEPTDSQQKVNTEEEYHRGARAFTTAWDSRHRFAHVKLVAPAHRRMGYWWIRSVALGFHARDLALYVKQFVRFRLSRFPRHRR